MIPKHYRGRRGHDGVAVDITITYAISAYHHYTSGSNLKQGEVYIIM